MKTISFFNHKGGVSKTTSTYHLAWMLTLKGKKVLLVDSDAQCNLTLTLLGEDNYEQYIQDNPGNDIKNGLVPAFESKPELIKPLNCPTVKGNDKLFLLPGNFDITEFEVQLGVSFQLTSTFSIMKNLPGSFYYLIQKTAEHHEIDYVLIDLNPSLSAINQDLIVSSDYFILPSSPDFFSEMAIKSIARVIPIWENWAKQARQVFKDSTYPLPLTSPKFLGYTINDYTIRSGEPAQAFQEVIDKIDNTVKNILVPALTHAGLMLPAEKYNNDYCLSKISNFQTLQPKYQKFGVPVFALTDTMLESTGVVLEGQQIRRANFHTSFSNFAEKVISMTL